MHRHARPARPSRGAGAGSSPRAYAVPLVDPLRRLRWPWSLAVGAASGLAGWFFYGARAGVVVAAAIAVVLVVGVSVRRLVALASRRRALATLPVLYLVDPAPRPTGLAFTYASHFIVGHWIGVAAMLSLAGAGVLGAWAVASAFRRHEPAPAEEPPLADFDRHDSHPNDRPATSAPRSTGAARGPPPR